ncbi:MAG: hypothetical protein MN733_09370 [Nitrososphaera sp.]|nr:hypothetical protein [Nitrososphaera sp.]
MKEAYKFEPHNMKGKISSWTYCNRCGLIALRNFFSDWAIRMGCNNEDHPLFAIKRKQFTGLVKRVS